MKLKKFSLGHSVGLMMLLSALAIEAGPHHEPGGCGRQHDGDLCAEGFCCSTSGFCGTTDLYCKSPNCQSQCHDPPPSPPPPPPSPPPPPPSPPPPPCANDVSSIISKEVFEDMIPFALNDSRCHGSLVYTYEAFISAARTFCEFGTTGSEEIRRREVAAFFGQTSHETTGGWPDAPGGPLKWGYCYLREVGGGDQYCVYSQEWPCVPGQQYYGRGPIQLSYNYNYGPAGKALGVDLLSNADLVATDPVVSFRTALWFWMTPQSPKPSCHDVMIGKWTPTPADVEANRLPGYGLVINIINGGLECGNGPNIKANDRIGFYDRYCTMLGTTKGDNVDCENQRHFGVTLKKPYPKSLKSAY